MTVFLSKTVFNGYDLHTNTTHVQIGEKLKHSNWKDTAELVGIFAILVSLIFVALQLHKEEQLLRLEMRSSMIANFAAVNESIVANAGVWTRGNAGEELDAVEMETYKRLMENFNDLHYQISLIFREIEPASEEQMLAMYAGFLLRNPGAYTVWINRERQLDADRRAIVATETITLDWINTIESRIAKIKSSSSH